MNQIFVLPLRATRAVHQWRSLQPLHLRLDWLIPRAVHCVLQSTHSTGEHGVGVVRPL